MAGDAKVQGDGETNLAVLAHNPTETRVSSVSPSPAFLLPVIFLFFQLSPHLCPPPLLFLPPSPLLAVHSQAPNLYCLTLTRALDPTGVAISSIILGSHGCWGMEAESMEHDTQRHPIATASSYSLLSIIPSPALSHPFLIITLEYSQIGFNQRERLFLSQKLSSKVKK